MGIRRFVFILRLWREDTETGSGQRARLRGSLQAVNEGRVYYFSTFDRLAELLREITRWPGNSPPPADGG